MRMALYQQQLLLLLRLDFRAILLTIRRAWYLFLLPLALGPVMTAYLLLIYAPVKFGADALRDGEFVEFLRIYALVERSLFADTSPFLILGLELTTLTGLLLLWAVVCQMMLPIFYMFGRAFSALFLKNYSLDARRHSELEKLMRRRVRSPYRRILVGWFLGITLYAFYRTDGFETVDEDIVTAAVEAMAALPILAVLVVVIYYVQVLRLDRERPELAILAYHVSRERIRDNFGLTIGIIGYFALLGWILLPGLLLMLQWTDSTLFGSSTFPFDLSVVLPPAAPSGVQLGFLSIVTSWTLAYPDAAAHWQTFVSYLFATVLLHFLSSTAGVAWARWQLQHDIRILRNVLLTTLKTTAFFLFVEFIIGDLFFIRNGSSEGALLFLFLLNFFLNLDQEAELAAPPRRPI